MDGALTGPWKGLAELEEREQNKIRFLLRNAADNDIVADGVAVKYGREWRINTDRLPDWLIKRTQLAIHGRASDPAPRNPEPPRNRRRGDPPRAANTTS